MRILSTEIQSVPSDLDAEPQNWQAAMRHAIRDPVQLCELLDLPLEWADRGAAAATEFPVFVPREYLARITRADVADPLLRQVLPLAAETVAATHFVRDPVGDRQATLRPGLLQKYHGRALIVVTGACAVHCRYCFRRHFAYSESAGTDDRWRATLEALRQDSTIEEVILSGGDPLTLSDARLAQKVANLSEVAHVRRLRIHTRLPIMIPQRVTSTLLGWLKATRLSPVVVVHANHPREIDAAVASALRRIIDRGVPVLNQSVLLRGVNDAADVLESLSRRLVNLGVIPYYVHQLDRVLGAAHFDVPISEGRRIIEELRQRLPGYAVPRYVQEIPGVGSKQVLA